MAIMLLQNTWYLQVMASYDPRTGGALGELITGRGAGQKLPAYRAGIRK